MHRRRPTRRLVLPALVVALAAVVLAPGVADAPVRTPRPLTCVDFRTPADAAEWHRTVRHLGWINPWGLDGDGDGRAC